MKRAAVFLYVMAVKAILLGVAIGAIYLLLCLVGQGQFIVKNLAWFLAGWAIAPSREDVNEVIGEMEDEHEMP